MSELNETSTGMTNAAVRRKPPAAEETVWSGRAVFVLLAVMMLLTALAYGGVDVWMIGVNSVLAGSIVLIWLIGAWKTGVFAFNRSPLQLPLIGLILIGLVQLLPLRSYPEAAQLLSVPPADALTANPYLTRLFVIQLIIAFVFLAAALTFIDNRKRFQSIALTIVIFGSVLAFYGILQHLANPGSIYGLRPTPQSNPFGPFFNQHHFAAFMEMSLGLALGLLFGDATRKNKKIFLGIAFVTMGMALLLTGSRGGIIGFLCVLGFVLLTNFLKNRDIKNKEVDEDLKRFFRRRNMVMFGGGFALVLILFIAVLFVGGDQSLLRGLGLSEVQGDVTSGRSHFWWVALQIFFDHPVLGAGFDSYGTLFPQYDTWNGTFRVEQAHNDYLQILADAGIAGFICVAAFIYLLFRNGLRAIRKNTDRFVQNGALGALAGCFGILVHSFFDFPLRTPSNALFFLMLAALAVVPENFRRVYRKKKEIPA